MIERRGSGLIVLGLTLLVAVLALLALSVGPYGFVAPWRAAAMVIDGVFKSADEQDAMTRVVSLLRFPRVVLAIIAGYGLAVCGVTMQGVFRNPLADPYLLGIASGATVGAALVFALKLGDGGPEAAIGAFIGGVLTVWVVYRLSLTQLGRLSDFTLILSGVAIASLGGAITSFLIFLADPDDLRRIIFFTLGSLARAELGGDLWILAAVALTAGLGLQYFSRDLNALAFGDDTAMHLGVNPPLAKRWLLLFTCVLTSSIVAYAGVIGFVGLIVPHVMRLIVGPDHRRLLVVSGLAGAGFLILCDTAARTAIPRADIPVGVVTSFFGAPFLIALLRRRRPSRGFS